MDADRTLSWDWYAGQVPENVALDESAYLQTTYSFLRYRSRVPEAVRISRGASIYLGTMFDLGTEARVSVGQYALVNGAWIIADAGVEIGDYALISWNVVLMDTYRVPLETAERRRELERAVRRSPRRLEGGTFARPIRIGRNVWIGFDVCVLPGVSIGEGSVVGARSVVTEDVPPNTVVAGNPARVVRQLNPEEGRHAA